MNLQIQPPLAGRRGKIAQAVTWLLLAKLVGGFLHYIAVELLFLSGSSASVLNTPHSVIYWLVEVSWLMNFVVGLPNTQFGYLAHLLGGISTLAMLYYYSRNNGDSA
jgi:hypothetical protein